MSVLEKLAAERALRESIDAIDNPPMATTTAEDYSDDFAAYADYEEEEDEDEEDDEEEDEQNDHGVIMVT